MAYYPIMLDIKDEDCIVVGGGNVAYRKILALLECGSRVTTISDHFKPEIEQLGSEGRIKIIRRGYETGDIKGYTLVIAASDDRLINKQVAEEAQRNNIFINVVDNKEQSSFIVPSVLRRGDITIAIATNGKSPLLARKLREKLEDIVGKEYEELLERLYEARTAVRGKNLSMQEKLVEYEKIIEESGLITK